MSACTSETTKPTESSREDNRGHPGPEHNQGMPTNGEGHNYAEPTQGYDRSIASSYDSAWVFSPRDVSMFSTPSSIGLTWSTRRYTLDAERWRPLNISVSCGRFTMLRHSLHTAIKGPFPISNAIFQNACFCLGYQLEPFPTLCKPYLIHTTSLFNFTFYLSSFCYHLTCTTQACDFPLYTLSFSTRLILILSSLLFPHQSQIFGFSPSQATRTTVITPSFGLSSLYPRPSHAFLPNNFKVTK
jgi:hypothetical protein